MNNIIPNPLTQLNLSKLTTTTNTTTNISSLTTEDPLSSSNEQQQQQQLNRPSLNQIVSNTNAQIQAQQQQQLSSLNGPYDGFAHCVTCGDMGVKAAFYGKSKLYCSVACQNGIKKQSTTNNNNTNNANSGVKRTIEAVS